MKCIICGKEIEESAYSNKVLCSSECFHKNFWNEIVDEKDLHTIIDGVSYYICKENDKSYFRGHGGQKFVIKKNTGEVVATTNLWCQGDIPNEYRELLPDNAEFVYEKKELLF